VVTVKLATRVTDPYLRNAVDDASHAWRSGLFSPN